MGQLNGGAKNGKRGNIILFYIFVGPPVGGMLVFLYLFVFSLLSGAADFWTDSFFKEPLEALSTFAGNFILVTLLSYVFGGVQALATGLLISTISGPEGNFSYVVALIIPAIVGATVMLALAEAYQMPLGIGAFLGAIGVGASILIRFLFRRRFGKRYS